MAEMESEDLNSVELVEYIEIDIDTHEDDQDDDIGPKEGTQLVTADSEYTAFQSGYSSGSGSSYICRTFDPVVNDLEPHFRLTNYSHLKGNEVKVYKRTSLKLLKDFIQDAKGTQNVDTEILGLGAGMDVSVTLLGNNGLCLVQTSGCLYPVLDDPYMLGKIACANVLNDMYALGMTKCDNMLMLRTISAKLTAKQRNIVFPFIMHGFKDAAKETGTIVTGGQTNINPWISVGGIATIVCEVEELIFPVNAVPGDVIVLTKPLGTEVALLAYEWLVTKSKEWNKIKSVVSVENVRRAYFRAMESMSQLNKTAARFMQKYNAHCGIAVSNFGLLGHAKILARKQREKVSFVIHNLPIIATMDSVDKVCGDTFGLLRGYSAETSGGLLICLPREQAIAYCKDIKGEQNYPACIIGIVEKGNRTARIVDYFRVIQVPAEENEGMLW